MSLRPCAPICARAAAGARRAPRQAPRGAAGGPRAPRSGDLGTAGRSATGYRGQSPLASWVSRSSLHAAAVGRSRYSLSPFFALHVATIGLPDALPLSAGPQA